MRNSFIQALEEEAAKNKNIIFVTGDLGFSVIENFQKKFPNQFLNAGIAEQNMTGLAAGLASTGKIVLTYSIGNFSTLRCLEQVRNDICYHNLNVKVIAVGVGFHYGALASTHHATEDIAIMRSLPNMTVIAPGDRIEAGLATHAIIHHPGPCYLRIAGEPPLYSKPPKFIIGKAITTRPGKDMTIIAAGTMLKTALDVADILKAKGISVRVLSMHTIKPIDKVAILKAAKETGYIATIEEHTIIGGLGGAVAEVLATNSKHLCTFQIFGVPDTFSKKVGGRDFLRIEHGLEPKRIATEILKARK